MGCHDEGVLGILSGKSFYIYEESHIIPIYTSLMCYVYGRSLSCDVLYSTKLCYSNKSTQLYCNCKGADRTTAELYLDLEVSRALQLFKDA